MKSFDDVLDSFIYGLECGYPPCCVMWYCTTWVPNKLSNWFIVSSNKNKYTGNPMWEYEQACLYYISCPNCIVNFIENKEWNLKKNIEHRLSNGCRSLGVKYNYSSNITEEELINKLNLN